MKVKLIFAVAVMFILGMSVNSYAQMSGDRQAMMSAMKELRERNNKKIETLLTDEQQIEWKKIQEERAQRAQGMGRGQ